MNVGVGVKVGVAVGVFVAVGVGVKVGVFVGVRVGVSVGVGVYVEVAVGVGGGVCVGVDVGVLKPTIRAITPSPLSGSGFGFDSPVCQYAALSSSATTGKSASATHRDLILLGKSSSLGPRSGPYKIPQLTGTVK